MIKNNQYWYIKIVLYNKDKCKMYIKIKNKVYKEGFVKIRFIRI